MTRWLVQAIFYDAELAAIGFAPRVLPSSARVVASQRHRRGR